MTMTVEQVGPVSAAQLAGLHARCFDAPWSEREMASLLNLPGCTAWACRRGGAMLALALFRQAADEAELLTLATDPDHRRSGLAGSALEAGEMFLKDQGVARIFLEVSTRNPGAAALYEARGYRECALRRTYYRDGSDARVLEKWLSKDGQTAP